MPHLIGGVVVEEEKEVVDADVSIQLGM